MAVANAPSAAPAAEEEVALDMYGLPVRKYPLPPKKTAPAVAKPAELEKSQPSQQHATGPPGGPAVGVPAGPKPAGADPVEQWEQGQGVYPNGQKSLKDFRAVTILFGILMWPAFWTVTYHLYYKLTAFIVEDKTYGFGRDVSELSSLSIRFPSLMCMLLRPHSLPAWILDSIFFSSKRAEAAPFYQLDRAITHLVLFPWGLYIMVGWLVQFVFLPEEAAFNYVAMPLTLYVYSGHYDNLKIFWKNGNFALVSVRQDGSVANGSMAYGKTSMQTAFENAKPKVGGNANGGANTNNNNEKEKAPAKGKQAKKGGKKID